MCVCVCVCVHARVPVSTAFSSGVSRAQQTHRGLYFADCASLTNTKELQQGRCSGVCRLPLLRPSCSLGSALRTSSLKAVEVGGVQGHCNPAWHHLCLGLSSITRVTGLTRNPNLPSPPPLLTISRIYEDWRVGLSRSILGPLSLPFIL